VTSSVIFATQAYCKYVTSAKLQKQTCIHFTAVSSRDEH